MQPCCSDLEPVLAWLRQAGYEFTDREEHGLLKFLVTEMVDLERLQADLQLPFYIRPCSTPDGRHGLVCTNHQQLVLWPVPPEPVPAVCEHLDPVFRYLEAHGNTVRMVDRWPPPDEHVVWRFRHWADHGDLQRRLKFPPELFHWLPGSPHDPEEEGLSCRVHHQSITWSLHRDWR